MNKLIVGLLLLSHAAFAHHYYIDPNTGNDRNAGTTKQQPWKTFERVNALQLAPGDVVEVLAPGTFHQSLIVKGGGDRHTPAIIKFAPGRYDMFPDGAVKKQLHITNTNDRPYDPKAIALFFDSCQFVTVEAKGATMVMRGKMIEAFVDHSHVISIHGLSFDYHRPTVSELTVTEVRNNFADVTIHAESKFSIKDSVLTWEGEGWRYNPGWYWQVLDPASGDLYRMDMKMENIRFVSRGKRNVRIYFTKDPGFRKGCVYQNRDVTRDCAGIFMQYSSWIDLKDVNIFFMHGMGVVSQFCHNVSMDNVKVKPPAGSGRTCAAWADILHFSGCSGEIEVNNCELTAANDDAINVHGTHLKVMSVDGQRVRVRFMHDQTYGFEAFAVADSIAFIDPASLLPVEDNRVAATERINDKEFLLTLDKPVSSSVKAGLVIENTTATAEVWIHHTTISRIPTRGILVTTRRKVRIEDNNFYATHMSGISISDDAASWFESGMVKDVTIRNNKFNQCGEPVISIHPENAEKAIVHNNVTVINNVFYLKGSSLFFAKGTSNIKITGNTIHTNNKINEINDLLRFEDCEDVLIEGNKIAF